jgi:hypothetical protein
MMDFRAEATKSTVFRSLSPNLIVSPTDNPSTLATLTFSAPAVIGEETLSVQSMVVMYGSSG